MRSQKRVTEKPSTIDQKNKIKKRNTFSDLSYA